MRFSIIVPVYNAEAYLSRAVASVQGQTGDDWELLLIDDGSADSSAALIREYAAKDSRIRGFYQENRGQLRARRCGIDHARGEYVLFLDSDDALTPDCLSVLRTALDQKAWDMVLFTGAFVSENETEQGSFGVIASEKKEISAEWLKKKLLFSNDLNSLCIKMIRRELFLNDPDDDTAFRGKCLGEDKVQLLHPVSQAEKILFLPDCLYRYYQREESVVHGYTVRDAEFLMAPEMFRRIWEYAFRWDMMDRESRIQLKAYYMRTFLSAYYGIRKKCRADGQMREFRKIRWSRYLDESIFSNPLSHDIGFAGKCRRVCFAASFFCPALSGRERLKLMATVWHIRA